VSAAARERAREALSAAAARAADVPALELVEREGDPARELVEASRQADLLVAGSRGYGPVRRLLLGSVSTLLVRQADCPLLVLPRSAEGGDADGS
jgi:nucleotide-binding universal stress UspA family protein